MILLVEFVFLERFERVGGLYGRKGRYVKE